jgi:hypothetical protein
MDFGFDFLDEQDKKKEKKRRARRRRKEEVIYYTLLKENARQLMQDVRELNAVQRTSFFIEVGKLLIR